MAQRKFVVLAVLAAAGVTAGSAPRADFLAIAAVLSVAAALSARSHPSSSLSRPPDAPPPNFDALDDDDDLPQGPLATPGQVL